MCSKRFKSLLRKIIISTLITINILGGMMINVYAKTSDNLGIAPFQIKENSVAYEKNLPNIEDIIKLDKKQEKPSVLIYHSHSQETYKDWDIIKAGEYLTENLEALGVSVTHIKEDFSGKNGYNKSYSSSREYIKDIVKDYNIVIDLHRNSESPVTKNNVAKGMMVYASDTNTYSDNKLIGDTIKSNMTNDLMQQDIEYTQVLANKNFNQDLGNVLLFECGGVDNTKDQVIPLIKSLSKSIDTYLKNK